MSLCPLPATEPVWSCQSTPVVMPNTNTDSPLSVPPLHLSTPPFLPPSGHHSGTSTRLDRTLSPTTMTLQSTTINLLLIAVLACLSVRCRPLHKQAGSVLKRRRNKGKRDCNAPLLLCSSSQVDFRPVCVPRHEIQF